MDLFWHLNLCESWLKDSELKDYLNTELFLDFNLPKIKINSFVYCCFQNLKSRGFQSQHHSFKRTNTTHGPWGSWPFSYANCQIYSCVSALGGWQLPIAELLVQKLKTTIRFHYRPLALFIFSLNSGLFRYGEAFKLKLILKKENMKKLQQVQNYLASL